MGRRAYKKVTVNGSVTLHQRYIYRGYLLIACSDLTRSHHPDLSYILWDPTQPVATRPLAIQINGTWYTYGWNLTKNICELYSTSGTISTSYTYTPFGSVTASGSIAQPIQWSSEVWDEETQLCYARGLYVNAKYATVISKCIDCKNNMTGNTSFEINEQGSDLFEETQVSSPTPMPPVYQPYWQTGNCYSYAINRPEYYSLNPGDLANDSSIMNYITNDTNYTFEKVIVLNMLLTKVRTNGTNYCNLVKNAAIRDGLKIANNKSCPIGYYRVYLVVSDLTYYRHFKYYHGTDYHWFREDYKEDETVGDPMWSYKQGPNPFIRQITIGEMLDKNNPIRTLNLIYENAGYLTFYNVDCGYMCAKCNRI